MVGYPIRHQPINAGCPNIISNILLKQKLKNKIKDEKEKGKKKQYNNKQHAMQSTFNSVSIADNTLYQSL